MRPPVIALAAIALYGLTSPLHASTILNENFDELTPQLSATSVGAFSAINGTNVDIVGGGLFGYLCVAPESGNCIDMDGSGGNPKGQLQSNQLFAAGTYNLSFDLIGDQRGTSASTTVTFGNYDQGFTLASNDTSSGIVINELVTLTSPGYLDFTSDDPAGDDAGTLLDNVVVSTANTTVTPEPSALLLFGTGLASFAGVLRKRFV
jgi:PEP-CTERM motif